MSEILVSQARMDQTDIIVDLHNDSFSSWIHKYGILYGYKNIDIEDVENWIKLPNSIIWLAYDQNEPVGYAHCRVEETNGKNSFYSLVFIETKESLGQSKIAVLPGYRDKGIANNIMKTVFKYYKSQNIRNALAFAYNKNKEASKLFSKLGFVHKPLYYNYYYSETKPYQCDSVLATFDLNQVLPKIIENKNVIIRSIKSSDLNDMREIFQKCRSDVFGEDPTLDQILSWYDSDWGEETFVAELENKVIGCMEYNSSGIIGIPGVLPEYRNQGIGTALFKALLLSMKDNGINKALADTGFVLQHAISMYRRFNFDLSHELWNWVKILQ
ncbi:MAG: GNAT family N-acetyltransferase [Candidatus Hodarchaeales archaeon]|jgi:GNAT superfamily N-acetyltransferase